MRLSSVSKITGPPYWFAMFMPGYTLFPIPRVIVPPGLVWTIATTITCTCWGPPAVIVARLVRIEAGLADETVAHVGDEESDVGDASFDLPLRSRSTFNFLRYKPRHPANLDDCDCTIGSV